MLTQPGVILRLHQCARLLLHHGHVECREGAHAACKLFCQRSVGGRDRCNLRLKPVGIAIDGERTPVAILHLKQPVMVDHRAILHCAKLLPHAVERHPNTRTEQVMNATVEGVALAIPRCTQPAGNVMQLENVRFVAVHLRITARRQSGDARPDDDDLWRHDPANP